MNTAERALLIFCANGLLGLVRNKATSPEQAEQLAKLEQCLAAVRADQEATIKRMAEWAEQFTPEMAQAAQDLFDLGSKETGR